MFAHCTVCAYIEVRARTARTYTQWSNLIELVGDECLARSPLREIAASSIAELSFYVVHMAWKVGLTKILDNHLGWT